MTIILTRDDFPLLLAALQNTYHILGPTVRDGAIVYDTVQSIADFPLGWTDVQEAGTYRLQRRNDEAVFGYTMGPQSWKRFLHVPRQRLWQATQSEHDWQVRPEQIRQQPMAFIGVRSCELHAIAIQDRIFLHDQFTDSFYQARRENVMMIAVNCGQAGGTCFCVSMNTGPQVTAGFDLSLTEVLENGQHYFVVEVGTEKGQQLLRELPQRAASPDEIQQAKAIVTQTAAQMGRVLDTTNTTTAMFEPWMRSAFTAW